MRARGTRVVASTYHCDVVVLKSGSCGCRVGRVGFKDYKLIVEGVKEWQNISVGTLQGWEREDRSGPRGGWA